MAVSSDTDTSATQESAVGIGPSLPQERQPDPQLMRWGGGAGLGGVLLFCCTVVVVGALGLPDASDVETLTDFADIESGRIAEHLLYLGALMLFALHIFVLHRLLATAHKAAALFGTVMAAFGLVIMAASSMLHVSTAPLADLYTAPDTTPEDLRAIEYAWHGTQSVFDTMLTTGALLVPIGIILFGVAMWRAPEFGPRLAMVTIGLGVVGVVGATVETIDTSTEFVAASVLAIVVFHLITGWRTLKVGQTMNTDLTDHEAG
ncbi:MAG: DUF4386 family protein [Actinomycetia bacterium]|nr:DUF4386 family protein [Actinomycetes bacterium]